MVNLETQIDRGLKSSKKNLYDNKNRDTIFPLRFAPWIYLDAAELKEF